MYIHISVIFSVSSPNDEFEVKLISLISINEGVSSSLLHEKKLKLIRKNKGKYVLTIDCVL